MSTDEILTPDADETFGALREFFSSVQDKFLRTQPMYMRLGFIGNMICKAFNDGLTDSDINWDKVNEYLTDNVGEYDFNCFDRIDSFNALTVASVHSREACLIGAWRQGVCRDCGTKFFMSYDEVKFFERKGLKVPVRCKSCRAIRKQKRENPSGHDKVE